MKKINFENIRKEFLGEKYQFEKYYPIMYTGKYLRDMTKSNENKEIINKSEDDNYTFNDNNLTRNQSLKYLKFANEFFADLNIELFDKKRKIKNRNKINFNKNHSFDEIDLNKNGGKHENNKTDKKINKNYNKR